MMWYILVVLLVLMRSYNDLYALSFKKVDYENRYVLPAEVTTFLDTVCKRCSLCPVDMTNQQVVIDKLTRVGFTFLKTSYQKIFAQLPAPF